MGQNKRQKRTIIQQPVADMQVDDMQVDDEQVIDTDDMQPTSSLQLKINNIVESMSSSSSDNTSNSSNATTSPSLYTQKIV